MEEFNTPVLQAAIAVHEIFLTLQKAGFTERQAILFCVELLRPASLGGVDAP